MAFIDTENYIENNNLFDLMAYALFNSSRTEAYVVASKKYFSIEGPDDIHLTFLTNTINERRGRWIGCNLTELQLHYSFSDPQEEMNLTKHPVFADGADGKYVGTENNQGKIIEFYVKKIQDGSDPVFRVQFNLINTGQLLSDYTDYTDEIQSIKNRLASIELNQSIAFERQANEPLAE